ncbi:MAG: hypothetical protein J6D21_02025 [Clostridia bacterium]|nr:hypothetical protein [Clostridia bacterium]
MSTPCKRLRANLRFFHFHFWRRLWLFLLIAGWTGMCLYTHFDSPENVKDLVRAYEFSLLVPGTVLSVFLFNNPTELEFCQCYGFSPIKLGAAQLFPTVLFSLLSFGISALALPEKFFLEWPQLRWLLFLTASVNLLTVIAAVVMARVLIRNMFGTLGAALLLFYGVTMSSFVTAGPGAYYVTGMALYELIRQGLPMEAFYINRTIFVGITAALTVAVVLILRSGRYGEKDA